MCSPSVRSRQWQPPSLCRSIKAANRDSAVHWSAHKLVILEPRPKVAPSEKAGTNAIAKTFTPRAKPKRNGAKRFERKSSLRPSGRCCRVDEEGAKAKQKGIQQRDRPFGKIETGELHAT
jgi:hypothetical protein